MLVSVLVPVLLSVLLSVVSTRILRTGILFALIVVSLLRRRVSPRELLHGLLLLIQPLIKVLVLLLEANIRNEPLVKTIGFRGALFLSMGNSILQRLLGLNRIVLLLSGRGRNRSARCGWIAGSGRTVWRRDRVQISFCHKLSDFGDFVLSSPRPPPQAMFTASLHCPHACFENNSAEILSRLLGPTFGQGRHQCRKRHCSQSGNNS